MLFNSLKAHASRHALLTLAVCTLIPATAMAAAPMFAPAAGWDVNAGQLSNVRGLKPMKLPCVLSTEYDNGYVVRFSGGGNKMLALAVDFRQDVFKQGRQYDAMISLGTGYVKQVKATAFTPSTLIFNLRPLGDFYAVAQNANDMEIDVEGNTMKFSLGRIGAAYPKLESCYTGDTNAAPVKPITTQTASKAPVAAVESAPVDVAQNNVPQPLLPEDVAAKPLPQSFDDIVRGADAEGQAPAPQAQQMKRTQVTPKAAPAEPSQPVQQPAAKAAAMDVMPMPAGMDDRPVSPRANIVSRAEPSEPQTAPRSIAVPRAPQTQVAAAAPAPAAPVPAAASAPAPAPVPATWDAKAGEDLKIVLSRWAERAGYDLQWQSEQDGKVAQDLKLTGTFEDAVGQLLAENSAATGIAGHVQTTAGSTKDLGPKTPAEPAPKAPPVQASIPAMHDQWSAAPGTNIQAILDQWSSKAGVAIVWQSYMDFAVKQPINVSGTYEQAVQSLLDQYMNDSVRPVGQLNTDPETGTRTLLMDKSS